MTDPRQHRLVRKVDGNRMSYVCGCWNEIHEPSGVLRSLSKCAKHEAGRREVGALGREYYAELGTIDRVDLPHVIQLTEALGPIPKAFGRQNATEIGCGASPYAGAIKAAGYDYLGIDPSQWATTYTRETHGVRARTATIEDSLLDVPIEQFILAAHVLEHLADAPGIIIALARMLKPGGELWIIVPDDSDPINSDHIFFFNQDTLRGCVEAAGLEVRRLTMRKYIPRENFIYCRARKPY
jgi:SAM-dependent methyltransferase